jgi:hypothetical protein
MRGPGVACLVFAGAAALVGCAPEIGDECRTSLDCSAQGTRLCDRTQPGGYCTIAGCEKGSCPEEAVCVKFRANVERLAVSYCMLKCEDSGDCRDDDGYKCTRADDFGAPGEALVLGRQSQEFCIIPAQTPAPMSSVPDPPMSLDDGGDDDDASTIAPDGAL